MRKKIFFLIFVLSAIASQAQYLISGTVTDESKESIPGVQVKINGQNKGTVTDFNGKYQLEVNHGDIVVFTYVGYEPQSVKMDGRKKIDVVLKEGVSLDEVVITGNRSKPRTILDSPVPIDNINAKSLEQSGKVHVEEMLTYKVPSFNSQTQPISDATAHFDPADLRALGPSRTLVLINGKRKNQSAQIYLNGTPGKGEVGIDLKSFPNAAIERIEVLRDGASAQYGSDAIAGVINIILKDKSEHTELKSNSGITKVGDGFFFGTDLSSSVSLGKGHMNYTLEYYKQNITNRAGEPGVKDLPAPPDPTDLTTYPLGSNDPQYILDRAYYDNLVQWATDNPRLGMIVGDPELQKMSTLVNITYPVGKNAEFYTFHTFTSRVGKSFAYYRAPYWREDIHQQEFFAPYTSFIGYHPSFETNIYDNMNVAGIKFDLFDDIKTDLSVTYGRNAVFYTVNNSVNRKYLADHGWSPRTFHPGGYSFDNIITNLDFSKNFGENINTSFGFEYKIENYKGYQGDSFSFYKSGSDSFAGIKPKEAVDASRNSFASYLGVDYDVTKKLLLGTAVRYENFSDFGDNVSWKVNSRYKVTDKISVRGSYNTGFRAPSLHQRHIQLTQYIVIPPNPDPQLQGTLPNNNPAVRALGVPNLHAETSNNLSFGLTGKIGGVNVSADVYQIDVNDRVLFSSQIKPVDGNLDGSDPVEQILIDNDVLALQFFINAVNTRTKGVDVVLDYPNIEIGTGKMGLNLSMNFNNTEIVGEIATPKILKDNGYNIFNHQEQMRITDVRPKSKILFGIDYKIGKYDLTLNNTYFGKVTVAAPDPADDQVLNPKVVTDFSLNYKFSNKFNAGLKLNNIFDVYPDELVEGHPLGASGRFKYSTAVQQMGIRGANYAVSLNFKF